MNRDYALFSSMTSGRHTVYGQCYPYGVMWNEPDVTKGSFLWVTVPWNDGPRLRDHVHGVSERFIQFLQHEGTLLAAVDGLNEKKRAHEGCWWPYVLVHIPSGWKAVIDEGATDGRLFLHYGSVLISFQSTERFTWDRKPGTLSEPKSPNSEFRIKGDHQAFALETAHPSDFPAGSPRQQLEAFREAILKNTKLRHEVPKTGTVAYYTNWRGVNMECPFDGYGTNVSTINGQLIDFDKWPQVDNPWMKQAYKGDTLTVTDGKKTRVYNFKTWTMTDN
jgi:hypothetical protein